ncbi:MAG: hypothetical protein AB7E23_00140 [Bacilli bacterium]
MKVTQGAVVKAKLKNQKKFYDVIGTIDKVYENGSYLEGTWYAIIITGGDMTSTLVEFLAHERMVAIIPERNIKEVIKNEQK